MTDFRRPDLDLWEEDAEDEDARPTLVGPRPTAPVTPTAHAAPVAQAAPVAHAAPVPQPAPEKLGTTSPAAGATPRSTHARAARTAEDTRRALTLQAASAEARGLNPADTTLTDDYPPFQDHEEEDTRPIPPNFPALLADAELELAAIADPESTLTHRVRQNDAIARLRAGETPREERTSLPAEELRASEVDRLTVKPVDEWGAFVDGLQAELPEGPALPPPPAALARPHHPTLRGLGIGTLDAASRMPVPLQRSAPSLPAPLSGTPASLPAPLAHTPGALPAPTRVATLTGMQAPTGGSSASWPVLTAPPTPLPAPAPLSVAWPAVAPAVPPRAAPSDSLPTPVSVRPAPPGARANPELALPERNPETERVYGGRKAPPPAPVSSAPKPAPVVVPHELPKPIPQATFDGLSSIAPASDTPDWGAPAERPKAGITWLQLAAAALVMAVVSLFVGTYGRQISRTGGLFAKREEVPTRTTAAASQAAPRAVPSVTPTIDSPPVAEPHADAPVAAEPVAPAPVAAPPHAGAREVAAPPTQPSRPAVASAQAARSAGTKAAPPRRDYIYDPNAKAEEPSARVVERGEAPGEPAPAVARRSDLPAQPAREGVVEAMNAVLPALRACAGELHGNAELKLTVRSEGFVSYALVGGDYAGTKEGSCIAQAVRAAKFPEFTDAVVKLTYPVRL